MGLLLTCLSEEYRGFSASAKVSFRGEGGDDEQTDVAAVTSPSEVLDVRVDVLENLAVSFKGSNLRRSGEKLPVVDAEFEVDVAAELTRRGLIEN